MNKLFTFLILIVMILFVAPVQPVQAADHYNAGTITMYESRTSLTYVWTLTVPLLGDSAGSWHSRPMFIADANDVDGYTYAIGTAGTGTEDVNIIYHFSYDDHNTWFSAVTPHTLDAVGGTAKHDTIGIESTANVGAFHSGRFLVVEYDGQTGNESGRAFTFIVTLTKDADVTDNAGGYVKLGSYARITNTNP